MRWGVCAGMLGSPFIFSLTTDRASHFPESAVHFALGLVKKGQVCIRQELSFSTDYYRNCDRTEKGNKRIR